MPHPAIRNMRITFYGTQGSGSVFPSREERQAFRRRADVDLLTRVFDDLAKHADARGGITATVDDIIGGPISPQALAEYAERLESPEPRVYGGWTTCVHIETADG